MPSPDIRDFVDLTLYDLESQSIYLAALDYVRVAMPDFRPVEGSVETVLMQAVAVEVAELVRSINRLPGGVLQALLKLFEVERLDGISPSALVRINGSTSSEYEIPVGTRLFHQSSLDTTPLVLETDSLVQLTHAKTVSAGSVASSVYTITTATPHGFSVGLSVTFSGTDSNTFNVARTIVSIPTIYSFTCAATGSAPSSYTVAIVTPPGTHPATGFVQATGTTITEDFNGLASGTQLDLLSVVPQISSAYLASSVSGGQDTESESDYFSRATANLSRENLSLVTADNYTQWIANNASYSSIYRARTLDSTNNLRVTTAGSVLMLVAPLDASSVNKIGGVGDGSINQYDATWGIKDDVRMAAMEISHPNLTVLVSDPVLVSVKVSATVSPALGKTGTEATTGALAIIEETLSPNTWDWTTRVRKNDIIAKISNSTDEEGNPLVAYVSSVVLSVDDVYIPEGSYAQTQVVSSFTVNTGFEYNVATTGPLHGLSNTVVNYVALKHASTSTWYAFKVVAIPTSSTFRVDLVDATPPTSGYTRWVKIGHIDDAASVTGPGDLIISDPAPLVLSGDHEITIS